MTENFGQDNNPHLTFYDDVHLLSFVYDLNHDPYIAVSYGGYGEAVFDRFTWLPDEKIVGLSALLITFQMACEAYIRGWRGQNKFREQVKDADARIREAQA